MDIVESECVHLHSRVMIISRSNSVTISSELDEIVQRHERHERPGVVICRGGEQKKKWTKTYNTGYSLVVTDPTTNPALTGLSRGERTGSRVLQWIWSYVLGMSAERPDVANNLAHCSLDLGSYPLLIFDLTPRYDLVDSKQNAQTMHFSDILSVLSESLTGHAILHNDH